MNESTPIPPPLATNPSVPQSTVSVWIRLVAVIVDGFIVVIPSFIVMMVLPFPDFLKDILMSLVAGALLVAINWNHLQNGQTIGKKMLGLRIVRKDGSAAAREHIVMRRILPLWVVGAIPILGPLLLLADALCIFRPANNTLHDDYADTKIIPV